MKRLILACLVGGGCLTVFAQRAEPDTTISRNVEIVKDYNPVIQDAGKINTMPELKDIETKKILPNYSVRTTLFPPKNDVIPTLDYATTAPQPQSPYKDGMVKAGGGNYTSFLGEVYTPIYKDAQYLVDVHLKHNSSFGNVELTPKVYPSLTKPFETQALTIDNKARISLLKNIRNREFISSIGGGYNRFDYYGYDSFVDSIANIPDYLSPLDDDYRKQAFTDFDINLRYRTKEYISKWKYDLQTNYQFFRNINKMAEHTVYTNVMGDYRMEGSALGANLEMYNIFMNRPDSTLIYGFKDADNSKDYTVIKLNPYYTFDGKAGVMVIGIKSAFSIGQGRPGVITPDIYGNIKLIDQKMYLYAGVTGDFAVNNYRTVSQLNKYFSPDKRVEDTYIPIDAYVGTKINFFNRINADFFVGYKMINNPYFFVNKSAADSLNAPYFNTFDVVYDKDAGLFNAGLTLLYSLHDKLTLTFKSKYNSWSLNENEVKKPWQMPVWEIDFQAGYCVTDYLRFNLAYRFEGGRYALINGQEVSMNDVNDLSIGVNYKLMSFMNIFLNLNNLINQEYAHWYGYTAHRFNVMGGVSILF